MLASHSQRKLKASAACKQYVNINDILSKTHSVAKARQVVLILILKKKQNQNKQQKTHRADHSSPTFRTSSPYHQFKTTPGNLRE